MNFHSQSKQYFPQPIYVHYVIIVVHFDDTVDAIFLSRLYNAAGMFV